MSTVEIEYCVPCGFLNRAEEIQHALLEQFGDRLDRVALVTGDRGVPDTVGYNYVKIFGTRGVEIPYVAIADSMTVAVDGDVVWDKADDDYDVDAITRRVRRTL